jgi:cholesterol transport system auxiliary component
MTSRLFAQCLARHLARCWVAMAVLVGSGCTGSLLDTKIPAPTVYVLHAAPAAPVASDATQSPLDVDLAVTQPTATPGLDTERIALLRDVRQLDFYAESQWGAALPAVTQALVVGTLQNQRLFRSVATEQARAASQYLLDLEVRDFQAEYRGIASPPTVRVTFHGTLIRIKDRKLLAVLPASVAVQAERNRMSDVVAAFESAAQQAALSLGQQAARAIAVNTPTGQ